MTETMKLFIDLSLVLAGFIVLIGTAHMAICLFPPLGRVIDTIADKEANRGAYKAYREAKEGGKDEE